MHPVSCLERQSPFPGRARGSAAAAAARRQAAPFL